MRKKLKGCISVLLIFSLLFGATGTALAASAAKVTYNGRVYSYQANGERAEENLHGVFTTDFGGGIAYCGNHGILTPTGETVGASMTLDLDEYTASARVQKILYYGYGGPGQWSGFSNEKYNSVYQLFAGNYASSKTQACGISVTAMALTYAYKQAGSDKGRYYDISGFDEFLDYVDSKSLSDLPNGFKVYIMKSGKSTVQDLFTWEYNPEGYLKLKKEASTPTDLSLAGAKYGVYTSKSDASANRDKVATLTTEANGTTNTVTLKPGKTYYVKEYKAPYGFELDKTIYEKTITEDTTITVKSEEDLIKGSLYVKKTAAETTSLSLAGAKYGVYTSRADAEANSGRVATLTTDEKGKTNTVELVPDTYYIREYKAPEGFKLDKKTYSAVITTSEAVNGEVNVISSEEELVKGKLYLLKESSEETDKSLAGAKYGVYKTKSDASDNVNRIAALTTDKNGKTNTVTLLPGTYYVKEYKAPEGFELDKNIYTASIKTDEAEAGKAVVINSTDVPSKGWVALKKEINNDRHLAEACPEQYSLEGAKYGVYTSEEAALSNDQSQMAGILTTDKNGDTNTLTVAPGTYYVKEIEAPKGFAIDEEVYEVTAVHGETKTVKCADKPLVYSMEILLKKSSDEGFPLEGAVFKVEYYTELVNSIEEADSLEAAKTWEFKTDESGHILLSNEHKVGGDSLYEDENGNPAGLIGTYVFEEIESPYGYVLSKEIYLSRVTENGSDSGTIYQVPEASNQRQFISITVNKVDAETGEGVPQGHGSFEGAEYAVTKYDQVNEKDEAVGKIVLDENGEGTLDNLLPGEYKVYETKAPDGYVKNSEIIQVNAEAADKENAHFEYYVISEETPASAAFYKYCKDSEEYVAGAELAVYDSEGNEIERWITTEDVYVIKGLKAGLYTLKELSVPEGYLKAEDVEFEIKMDVALTKVEMYDDYTKVLISKEDMVTGKPVIGAELVVKDSEGNTVASWITDGEPYYIEKLPAGEYVLIEKSAPDGYMIAEEVRFEVKESMEIQKVVMKDKPVIPEVSEPDNPKTGDRADLIFWITVCCIAAGSLAAVHRKKYSR